MEQRAGRPLNSQAGTPALRFCPTVLIAPVTRLLTAPGQRSIVYSMADSKVQRNLRAAMKEALRIQDRFIAEPLFAKTGRGYLKSEGVSTLQKIKSNLRRKASLKGA